MHCKCSLHEGKEASLNHSYEVNKQGTLYPSTGQDWLKKKLLAET